MDFVFVRCNLEINSSFYFSYGLVNDPFPEDNYIRRPWVSEHVTSEHRRLGKEGFVRRGNFHPFTTQTRDRSRWPSRDFRIGSSGQRGNKSTFRDDF